MALRGKANIINVFTYVVSEVTVHEKWQAWGMISNRCSRQFPINHRVALKSLSHRNVWSLPPMEAPVLIGNFIDCCESEVCVSTEMIQLVATISWSRLKHAQMMELLQSTRHLAYKRRSQLTERWHWFFSKMIKLQAASGSDRTNTRITSWKAELHIYKRIFLLVFEHFDMPMNS